MSSTLRTALREQNLTSRYAEYSATWSIQEFEPGCWWILDGEVKVGLVVRGTDLAELVNTDPYHPSHDIAFPAVYHAATQPGDRVTLATWVRAQGSTSSHRTDLKFSVEAQGVTATFHEYWEQGDRACKRLTWRVDSDFGYILYCDVEMSTPQLEEHPLNALPEYCNFLPRGVTDDRPEFARYPYILWQHPSGRIVRWNQNNIGARALGALDIHDRRRVKTGGFIGFFGEADRNIAIELLESSPATTTLTCHQMLDEHLLWVPPEIEIPAQDESGHYLYRAAYNLVSVPPSVGDALNARAEMLDMVLDRTNSDLEMKHNWCSHEFPTMAGEPKSLRFCPLATGAVTDFETTLDPASSFRGQVFPYRTDVDEPICVVSDCSHSGKHSLRLRPDHPSSKSEMLRAWAGDAGACLHVTEDQKYRLSAWIKTELDAGEATLIAAEFRFTRSNVTGLHQSTPVSGYSDWKYVAVEFTPNDKAHVVDMRVEANGRGSVWVDDILLEKVI
jgi:hypothetical protein